MAACCSAGHVLSGLPWPLGILDSLTFLAGSWGVVWVGDLTAEHSAVLRSHKAR